MKLNIKTCTSPDAYDATNFIKLFNAEGNFDLNWDQLPPIPVAGAGPANVFVKSAENPIAGQNTYSRVKYNKDGNGVIYVPYWHGNNPAQLDESSDVVAEEINGVRTPTYARTGKHHQAFIQGSEVGLSGILPITNYPIYDKVNDKMLPYILNGLSVKVTNYNSSTGEYTLNVNFGDYQVRNNKRWCGNIEMPPNPIPNAYSLEVLSGVTLTVDKSGTPNKKYEILAGSGDFVNPTILNCLSNSYINMQSNSNLIVDNNSTLKLSSNSKIDIGSGAILRVKRGSKLILEGNATINVLNGGRIIIEDDGSLDYYQHAQLKLTGNSVCEIKGMLNIKDNATFTFTSNTSQNGYLLFSNTSLFPSRNITAGVSANINITGSSQNRKILQIDQETFYAPPGIVNFTISNGKIVLAADARVQADGLSTAIVFNNAKFTSTTPGANNGHRGVHLYGQPNVLIDNCVFEYGATGIYAYLTYGGVPLNIFNSVFRGNTKGIEAYDKGCNLYNCYFFNNEFGSIGGYMSFPSVCMGSMFNGNTMGSYWHSNSTASYTLDNPYISHNSIGAKVQAAPLIVKCGSISYNNSGLIIRYGATLMMDDNIAAPLAADVTLIGNNYTIQTWGANNLFLNKGYNNLSPSGVNNQSAINGTMLSGGPNPMVAMANKWNSGGTFSTNDYLLTDLNGNTLTIDGSNYLSSALACGQAIPPCPNPPCDFMEGPLKYCPACEVINTDDFVNKKLNEATLISLDMLKSNDPLNYRKAIELFYQILIENIPNPDNKESYLLNLNYLKLLETVGYAFSNEQISCDENSNSLCAEVQMTIEIEDKFIDIADQQDNYYRKFLYNMDKAQTYRIACRRELCLNVLNDMLSWAEGDNIEEVNNFICSVNTEIDVLEGNIDVGSVAEMMQQCNHNNTFRIAALTNKITLSNDDRETMISIFPNPIRDLASLRTNIENAHVILFDGLGRTIFDEKINYDSDIDLSTVPGGIYTLKIGNLKTSEYWIKKLIVQ